MSSVTQLTIQAIANEVVYKAAKEMEGRGLLAPDVFYVEQADNGAITFRSRDGRLLATLSQLKDIEGSV